MRQTLAARGIRLGDLRANFAREVRNLPQARLPHARHPQVGWDENAYVQEPPADDDDAQESITDDGYRPEDLSHRPLTMTKNAFLLQGTFMLVMLSFMPVWDAINLLTSLNYTMFMGRSLPLMVIAICLVSVLGFMLMAEATLTHWRSHTGPRASVQNMSVAIAMLITLFGLGLVFVSMPLSNRAMSTYNALMFTCAGSWQTHGVWQAYEELLSLRLSPGCRDKYSVEDCVGFRATPETEYLKFAERQFRCTGFCGSVLEPSALVAGNRSAGGEGFGEELAPQDKKLRGSGNKTVRTGWLIDPKERPVAPPEGGSTDDEHDEDADDTSHDEGGHEEHEQEDDHDESEDGSRDEEEEEGNDEDNKGGGLATPAATTTAVAVKTSTVNAIATTRHVAGTTPMRTTKASPGRTTELTTREPSDHNEDDEHDNVDDESDPGDVVINDVRDEGKNGEDHDLIIKDSTLMTTSTEAADGGNASRSPARTTQVLLTASTTPGRNVVATTGHARTSRPATIVDGTTGNMAKTTGSPSTATGVQTTAAGMRTTGAGMRTTEAGVQTTGAGMRTTGGGMPTTGAGSVTTRALERTTPSSIDATDGMMSETTIPSDSMTARPTTVMASTSRPVDEDMDNVPSDGTDLHDESHKPGDGPPPHDGSVDHGGSGHQEGGGPGHDEVSHLEASETRGRHTSNSRRSEVLRHQPQHSNSAVHRTKGSLPQRRVRRAGGARRTALLATDAVQATDAERPWRGRRAAKHRVQSKHTPSLASREVVQEKFAPTLFSKANMQTACQHAAAWNVMMVPRNIGLQMWYLGVAMIVLATCLSLWDWKL